MLPRRADGSYGRADTMRTPGEPSFGEKYQDVAAGLVHGAANATGQLVMGVPAGAATGAGQFGDEDSAGRQLGDAALDAGRWGDALFSGTIDPESTSSKAGSAITQGVAGIGAAILAPVTGGASMGVLLTSYYGTTLAQTDRAIREANEQQNRARVARGLAPVPVDQVRAIVAAHANAIIETSVEWLSDVTQARLVRGGGTRALKNELMRKAAPFLGLAGGAAVEGSEEVVTQVAQDLTNYWTSPELGQQMRDQAIRELEDAGMPIASIPEEEREHWIFNQVAKGIAWRAIEAGGWGALGGGAGHVVARTGVRIAEDAAERRAVRSDERRGGEVLKGSLQRGSKDVKDNLSSAPRFDERPAIDDSNFPGAAQRKAFEAVLDESTADEKAVVGALDKDGKLVDAWAVVAADKAALAEAIADARARFEEEGLTPKDLKPDRWAEARGVAAGTVEGRVTETARPVDETKAPDPETKPSPDETREALDWLAPRGERWERIDPEQLEPDQRRVVDAAAAAGREAVYFTGSGTKAGGFSPSTPNAVYLNADAARSRGIAGMKHDLALVGHEDVHAVRHGSPDRFEAIVDALDPRELVQRSLPEIRKRIKAGELPKVREGEGIGAYIDRVAATDAGKPLLDLIAEEGVAKAVEFASRKAGLPKQLQAGGLRGLVQKANAVLVRAGLRGRLAQRILARWEQALADRGGKSSVSKRTAAPEHAETAEVAAAPNDATAATPNVAAPEGHAEEDAVSIEAPGLETLTAQSQESGNLEPTGQVSDGSDRSRPEDAVSPRETAPIRQVSGEQDKSPEEGHSEAEKTGDVAAQAVEIVKKRRKIRKAAQAAVETAAVESEAGSASEPTYTPEQEPSDAAGERAGPPESAGVPAGDRGASDRVGDDLPGDRGSLDAGVAGERGSADSERGLPAGALRAAGDGEDAPQPARERAPRKARAPRGARPERGAAGAEAPSEPERVTDTPRTPAEAPSDRGEAHTEEPKAPSGDDFTLEGESIGEGGLVRKFRENVAAVRLLKQLEAEGRAPTLDDRKVLSRYVGWGALPGVFDEASKTWAKQHAELKGLLTKDEWEAARRSTLNAHFTSPEVVKGMYAALDRLGFEGGRVLEPSVGIGNFFGLMPAAMRRASELHGVELDSLTSRMVAAVYPGASIAKATGFQDAHFPDEYFDLTIGNPPFGQEAIRDAERSEASGRSIHNYFFVKSLLKTRPGGLMTLVVSHYLMDKQDQATRRWIAQRADLVSAVRLPRTAFLGNAGTEVVTDILVLKRRTEMLPAEKLPAWVKVGSQANTNPKTGETVEHSVNTYFLENPGQVLGTPSAAGSMRAANEYTVDPSGDLAEQLAAWAASLPERIYEPVVRPVQESAGAKVVIPDGIKVGSYYVDEGGVVHQRQRDVGGEQRAVRWEPDSAMAEKRMRGQIELRDTLNVLMKMELSVDAKEKAIETQRKRLNKLYDEFVRKFGFVNSPANRRVFLEDADADRVLALEADYDAGISEAVAKSEGIEPRPPSAKKFDMFDRRVNFPPGESIRASTPADALVASLNVRGRLDLPWMESLIGRTQAEITAELGDAVYEDPRDGWVERDAYLSGDVKTKLEEAEAAARGDGRFRRNVDALRAVIPADKTPSEITLTLGAHLVPAKHYQAFAEHITGARAKATYVPSQGRWLFEWIGAGDPSRLQGRFGIPRKGFTADDLLEAAIASRSVVVKDRIAEDKYVVNEQDTAAARAKVDAIKDEWKTWVWQDAARAEELARLFNEKHNRIVERRFDGSHLTLPGSVLKLRPSQKNAVWRALQTRRVLLDHVVGAGKTFAMVAMAMEFRRLGISRKPLLAVPNHLTLQWRAEFLRMYPSARILVAAPEDFAADRRGVFFAKAATGDWDAVIVAHSSMKKIGLPSEAERALVQEQIDEIAAVIEQMKRNRGDRGIVKQMEKTKANLEAKFQELASKAGERDTVLDFSELGIDSLFVDEMHEFKNLFYTTTMDRVAGLGNAEGSGKAFDLFLKFRFMNDTLGDRAPIITATGTPVSNSLVEMFTMQRFMQWNELRSKGLHAFDAWAKAFGEAQSVYEVSTSGVGYRTGTRFARFVNMPALLQLYRSFADTITLSTLKRIAAANNETFPVPKIAGGRPVNIVAERSPQMAAFIGEPFVETDDAGQPAFKAKLRPESQFSTMTDERGTHVMLTDESGEPVSFGTYADEAAARDAIVAAAITPTVALPEGSLLWQFENLKQLTKDTNGRINALSLTTMANKAALDFRIIDPTAPDFAGSKINRSIDEMMKLYKKWDKDKGTQLVFCDLSVPLSERKRAAATASRCYVRDAEGALTHRRGTIHTIDGFETFPFLLVQAGKGEGKHTLIYDAATGALVHEGVKGDRTAAKAEAEAMLSNPDRQEKWVAARERAGEIMPGDIEDYNAEQGHDASQDAQAIDREAIDGASGAAGFSVYDDIRAKLIARGVPESEIAFIHDYAAPKQKHALFKAVNAGRVRFLLGSTAKLGAGTNVQERIVGLHHIDAPWRPSDLEQREGRGIRQGNKLYERDPQGFELAIFRYATDRSLDTRRWQILEHKSRGIEQLRNADPTVNEMEDVGGEAANAADMKAAASGDPLILEVTRLTDQVKKLRMAQAGHTDQRVALIRKAEADARWSAEIGPRQLKAAKELQAAAAANPLPTEKDSFVGLTVDGKRFAKREDAIFAIGYAVDALPSKIRAAFEYRGVTFRAERHAGYWELDTPTGNLATYRDGGDPFSAAGLLTRMNNFLERASAHAAELESEIARRSKQAVALRDEAQKPFAEEAELGQAQADLARVQRTLLARGPAVPERQKALVERATEEQRSQLRRLGLGAELDSLMGGVRYSRLDESEDEAEPETEPAPAPTPIQQRIEEQVGLRTPQVSEREALRGSLARQESTARVAYRAALQSKKAREIVAKAKAVLKRRIAANQTKIDDVRERLVGALDTVEDRLRGEFLHAATSIRTPNELMHQLERLEEKLAKNWFGAQIKRLNRDIQKRLKRAIVRTLPVEFRDVIKRELDAARTLAFGNAEGKGRRVKLDTPDEYVERAEQIKAHLEAAIAAKAEARFMQKELKALRGKTVAEAAGEMVKNVVKARASIAAKRGREQDREMRALDKYADLQADLRTLSQKVEGGRKATAFQILVTAFRRAESAKLRDRRRALSRIEEAAKAAGFRDLSEATMRLAGWLGAASQSLTKATLGGTEVTITLDQALGLVAMDQDTRDALSSGFVDESGIPEEIGSAIQFEGGRQERSLLATPAEIDALAATLPPQLVAFVRAGKSIRQEITHDRLFKVHRALKGYEPEEIPDQWPRVRNRDQVTEVSVDASTPAKVMERFLENAGILQSRTGGRLPLVVRGFLETLLSAIDQELHIIHFAEPLRIADTVMRQPELVRAINEHWGAKMNRRLRAMLHHGAGVNEEDRAPLEGVLRWLQSNVIRAWLTLNPKTYLKQLGGLGKVAAYVSRADLAAGALKALASSNNRAEVDRLYEFSGYFDDRHHSSAMARLTQNRDDRIRAVNVSGIVTALGAAARSAVSREGSDAMRNLSRAFDSINFLNSIDRFMAMATWEAFRIEGRREHPGMEADELDRWAATRAESVFRDTQNVSSPLEDPLLMAEHRGRAIATLLFPLTSDPAKSLNMLLEAKNAGEWGTFTKRALGIAVNIAWAGAVAGGFSAVVKELVLKAFGGDDDEERKRRRRAGYLVSVMEATARDLIGTLVPFGGDYLADAIRTASPVKYDQELGRVVKNSGISVGHGTMLQDAGESVTRLIQLVRKDLTADEAGKVEAHVMAGSELLALLTGQPFTPLLTEFYAKPVKTLDEYGPKGTLRFWRRERDLLLKQQEEYLRRDEDPPEENQRQLAKAEARLRELEPEDDLEERLEDRQMRRRRQILKRERQLSE